MRNTRLRITLRLAGSAFLILILSGCETIPPLQRSQVAQFEHNLVLWNSLLSRYPELPPITPPRGYTPAFKAETVREVNDLFAIAFDLLAAGERQAELGRRVGPVSEGAPEGPRKGEESVVRIALERGDSDSDPFVYGVLLTEDGWVATVRHPFDAGTAPLDRVYLTFGRGEKRYPLRYLAGNSETNTTIARFDLSTLDLSADGTPSPLLDVGTDLGYPAGGESAWVIVKREPVSLEVLDIERKLQLNRIGVYERNIVTNNPDSLEMLQSGSPLYTSAGSIGGLYYHRSLSGEAAGFAALSDLPRQLGYAILYTLAASPEGDV
jgi:hypothetical protein